MMDYEVKADELEASFDGVVMAAERPVLAASSDADVASGFEAFVRSGVAMERKSFNGSTGGEGGFAVPKEIDARIDDTLKAISPIRRIANVVKVGSAGYRKLVASGGVASGWVSETAARPETATPVFNEIAPAMGELYANPAASQAMLDDAQFDVEDWLAGEIAQEFGRAEGAAFVAGNGTNKPKGFLSYPTANTADGVRPFGTLQYLATGFDAQFPGTNATDKLIDLVQSLRAPYRQGAVWVMNSKTIAQLRKFKTGDGLPVWQPSLNEGAPSSLLGYPVIEAEDMPDMASGSLSVAFGNFQAGYLIAERAETQVLRDPYSNKPFTYFYALTGLDILVQAVVVGEVSAPPAAPEIGQCWLIGAAPTGAFAGKARQIAGWTEGGWRFAAATPGMRVWRLDTEAVARRSTSGWVSGAAVTLPGGGTVIDTEARAVIATLVARLREQGIIVA